MPFVIRKRESFDKPRARFSVPFAANEEITPAPYFRVKHITSRIGAVILATVALPLTLVLLVLVRLTSRGPGIYCQKRVGLHGQIFTLYKIRTMRSDAEAKTGPVWTEKNDPRVTRLGRLLRRVHLDELPQFLNVLRGEMTLIGPRPERPEFTQQLARKIPGYMDRYSVSPGITGLAQVNLPPDTDVNSVRRKLMLDLEYIRTASFLLDARIVLCTTLRLMGFPGRRLVRLMGVARHPRLPEHAAEAPAKKGEPSTYHKVLDSEVASGNGVCKSAPHKANGVPTA